MFELTHPQKRIIYNEQIYQTSRFANMYGFVEVKGYLEHQIVKALNEAIRYFDCLRIVLINIKGQIFQRIKPFKEGIFVKRAFDDDFLEEEISLFDDSLYRFYLVTKDNQLTGYYFIFHHSIVDAYTISLINRFIEDILLNKTPIKPQSFLEFVNLEKEYLKSLEYLDDLSYFKNQLSLSKSYLYQPHFRLQTKRLSVCLTNVETEEFLSYCKNKKVSVYKLMMAACFLCFYQETRKTHQTIATTHHNRVQAYKEVGGMMTSTIPIVEIIEPSKTLAQFLNDININISSSLNRHQFPIDIILNERALNECFYPTILKVIFNSIPFGNNHFNVERFSPLEDVAVWNFKLNPNSKPKGSPIELGVDYNIHLCKDDDASKMLKRIINIANLFVKSEHLKIADVIKTPNFYLDDIFQKITSFPETIALVDQYRKFTNKEVHDYVSSLIEILTEIPYQVIGIISERSNWYLIGILGILAAGKAFVVIDPTFPKTRIETIIKQTNLKFLITFSDTDEYQLQTINITLIKPVKTKVKPVYGDIAYLLFTSGSTGEPKGVIISSKNINSFYHNIDTLYPKVNFSRFLSAYNYQSDVSVLEFLASFKTSSTLYIPTLDIILNLSQLHEYITINQIDHILLPTALGELYIKYYPKSPVKSLLIAGEEMKYFQKTNYLVINGYGPTEFTILSHFKVIDSTKKYYPIGKPFDGITEIILDEHKQISNRGELYLIGNQMALGYLNNLSKTKEHFVEISNHGYAYKTGDLVQKDKNGDLIFIARVDRQIKHHGHRIELNEIESVSVKLSSIDQALCGYQNERIILFIVVNNQFKKQLFINFLKEHLPRYYLPHEILVVSTLPITLTGKKDYQALQKKSLLKLTAHEKKLLNIFKRFYPPIKINDNILTIGIDSLDMIKIAIQIEKRLKQRFQIANLYLYPTIKQLANNIHIINQKSRVKKIRTGSQKPLILVFDLSGDVLAYQNLINYLKADIPIYTVSAGMIPPNLLIKEYVKLINQELRTLIHDKQVDIVGYSSGGILALEMSLELGKQVTNLFLIDTPNYQIFPKRAQILFGVSFNLFKIIKLYGFKNTLLYSLKKLNNPRNIFSTQKRIAKLIKSSDFHVLNSNTILFASTKLVARTDQTLGWIINDAQIHYLEGDHITIMNEGQVIKIVKTIERRRNN